jgi:hypothetical protein
VNSLPEHPGTAKATAATMLTKQEARLISGPPFLPLTRRSGKSRTVRDGSSRANARKSYDGPMKPILFALSVASTLLVAGGCADDSNADDTTSEGTGGGGSLDWNTITPPANIDIVTCRSITEDPSGATAAQCSSCCAPTGFMASSFINNGRCTCGKPRADGRDSVCSAPAQANTPDTCTACCDAAGFFGETWVGGGTMTDSRCACRNGRDTAVCAGSLASMVPSESCNYCCLENGFLSATYTAGGAGECACIAP